MAGTEPLSFTPAFSPNPPAWPGQASVNEALNGLRQRFSSERAALRQAFKEGQISGFKAARSYGRLINATISMLAALTEHRTPWGASPASADGATLPPQPWFRIHASGELAHDRLAPFSTVQLLFSPVLDERWEGPAANWKANAVAATKRAMRFITRTLREAGIQVSAIMASPLKGAQLIYGTPSRHPPQHEVAGATGVPGRGADPFNPDTMAEPDLLHHPGGILALSALTAQLGASRQRWLATHPRQAWPGAPLMKRGRKILRFLWQVRFHLHYVAGRPGDRLTLESQPVLATFLRYGGSTADAKALHFMRQVHLMLRGGRQLAMLVHDGAAERPFTLPPQGMPKVPGAGSWLLQPLMDYRNAIMGTSAAGPKKDPTMPPHPGATLSVPALPAGLFTRMTRSARALARAAIQDSPTARHLRCHGGMILQELVTLCPHALQKLELSGLLAALLPEWRPVTALPYPGPGLRRTVDHHGLVTARLVHQLLHVQPVDVDSTLHAGQQHRDGEQAKTTHLPPGLVALCRLLSPARPSGGNGAGHDCLEVGGTATLLAMAALFHDMGKTRGIARHANRSARTARTLCARLDMEQNVVEEICWLIQHHGLLANAALQGLDGDNATILALADTIQSPERLRHLTILTMADLMAISPDDWNIFETIALDRLYGRLATLLEGGLNLIHHKSARAARQDVAQTGLDVRQALQGHLPSATLTNFLAMGSDAYWLSMDTNTHVRHGLVYRRYQALAHPPGEESNGHDGGKGAAQKLPRPALVEIQSDPSSDLAELTIMCPDRDGFLVLVSGLIAQNGLHVVDARLHGFQLTDHFLAPGRKLSKVLATFWLEDGQGQRPNPATLERVARGLRTALAQPDGVLAPGCACDTAPTHHASGPGLCGEALFRRVAIDNRLSSRHTVIEVDAPDGPGFLNCVARDLHQAGLYVEAAFITTYGQQVVDVFHVTSEGAPLTDIIAIERLRMALLKTVARFNQQGHTSTTPTQERITA
ncbi:HD domain-containing protein [Formicincola oecophyllae]|uniref:HD domain-containing protein n=1 Tax=Formicincola oecophyllae TaxID=2558361 RepID=A0A4Y6U8Y6_9PROT|nr:HD domain-containing protein [Formicincola oecophyllae]QDH13919.1 HD domain-containing protein [Formicincola oecophyllae]